MRTLIHYKGSLQFVIDTKLNISRRSHMLEFGKMLGVSKWQLPILIPIEGAGDPTEGFSRQGVVKFHRVYPLKHCNVFHDPRSNPLQELSTVNGSEIDVFSNTFCVRLLLVVAFADTGLWFWQSLWWWSIKEDPFDKGGSERPNFVDEGGGLAFFITHGWPRSSSAGGRFSASYVNICSNWQN